MESLLEDAYDDLMTAIEFSEGKLALLIAVCDDPQQRESIIQRYETELASSHQPYRVNLATAPTPSMNQAIRMQLEAQGSQQQLQPVFTVEGIDRLLTADRQQCFGYLQWTREATREFHFPIVIWVDSQTLELISTQAQDFWSWRKGTFRFRQ